MRKKEVDQISMLNAKIKCGDLILNEVEGKKILHEIGIKTPVRKVINNIDQAIDFVRENSFPVVLKGVVENITHKSDYNLIQINIQSKSELKSAFKNIRNKCLELSTHQKNCNLLIEKHVKADLELVVGLTTDRTFGKVLMFGLGGILIELVKDVSFKICPIRKEDAYDMIDSLRCQKIFEGFRGKKIIDKEKIVDFLMLIGGEDGIASKLSREIDELEINPAAIDISGNVIALDAVIKLRADNSDLDQNVSFQKKIDLNFLFSPKTIGIVGVSPDKPGLPMDFLKLLMTNKYKGNIYPINHNHDGKKINGIKIFGKISSIPEKIDYLYVSVPGKAVPSILEDGKGKIKFAQIISSGFSETGLEGKKLEEALLNAAISAETRLIGPNCLGMYCPSEGIFFVPGCPPEIGGVSIISQSGGITTEIVRSGGYRGIKFHQAISIGNSIDLGIEEFLEYMGGDPRSKVIGIYAEAIKINSRLPYLLKEISKIKPVVVFKGGRSVLGAKAASSHTGAMADNYDLWQAMCNQYGAILVNDFKEFLNTLLAFQSLDASADNSIFLVSHSGGLAVTGADLCEEYSLEIQELDECLQKEVFSIGIPPGASIKNPVDIPIGTLSAKIRPGEKLDILQKFYDYIGNRKHFAYNVLYLMTDNVMLSPNGENIVKALFDLAIEQGGFNGKRHRKFVLALNYSIRPEFIMKQCKRAAENGVTIYYDLAETLKSIGSVVQYGLRYNALNTKP